MGFTVLSAASKLCGAGDVWCCMPDDVYIDLYLARRQEGETRDNLRITTSHTPISFTFRYPSDFYPIIGTVIARGENRAKKTNYLYSITCTSVRHYEK